MEREKFGCKMICEIPIFSTYKCVLQKTSVHSRLGVIYNPTSKINEENTAISRGILAAFLTQKNSFLKNFLRKLAKEETATAIYSGEKIHTFLTEVSGYLFGVRSICCIFRMYKPMWSCYWKMSINKYNQLGIINIPSTGKDSDVTLHQGT